MFKGIGKQVVILKNTDSKIFEEAIFIVRDGTKAGNADILTECERIIKNYSCGNNAFAQKRKRMLYYALLIAGFIAIAAIVFIMTRQ